MDWPLDEDFDQAAPARAERQLVPEGFHDFKIERAAETAKELELVLAHPDKAYGWVWAKFPKGKGWAKKIVAGLPLALGLDAAAWARLEAEDLVGRKVRARVYHKPGNDGGRVFVNVGSFHAIEPDDGPPPDEPKKSRNAVPAAEAADDIPF
jgi:hypothetical protein